MLSPYSSQWPAHLCILFQCVKRLAMVAGFVCLLGLLVPTKIPTAMVNAAQQTVPVATVSAASFEATALAPESIVAAFGAGLATRVEIANTIPLPTMLAGTSVKVKDSAGTERLAQLFFVAPSQINYLIPVGTASGAATVTVASGDGAVSTGAAKIAAVAPALFTANATGQGVPAATVFRLKADGSQLYEPAARFDPAQNKFVPLPIDLGPADEQVFLLLFGSGLRNRRELADVGVKVGGVDAEVLYAGEQGGFAGLDQINLRLSRNLIGRGRVSLAITAAGFSSSNLTELEIASPRGAAPPQVANFGSGAALAGELLTVTGAGFDPEAANNLVRVAGVEARAVAATPTQLTIRVPFGVESGPVTVRTKQGEGSSAQSLRLRTSISGLVEDTQRQPLPGITVRVVGSNVAATTSADGFFILPDVPPTNAQQIEIDGAKVQGTLPYPSVQLKLRVQANRDNQLSAPVALQQVSGPSLQVGSSPFARLTAQQTGGGRIQTGNVIFEAAGDVAANFPDGATGGQLTLSLVAGSRTPVSLPPGTFSSTVAQIAPFGVKLSPGGKLTFPNSDGFPAGTQAQLFRLDQTPGSPTVGSFVESGAARVSADGQRIETAPNAVTDTSIYFAAIPRPTTTVVGRVVDSDGVTPVRLALVRSRGQEVFTDGNGGFVLRNVLVNTGDEISVEASFARATGRVDRVQRARIAAAINGVTTVAPDLVLPSETSNRLPVIFAPLDLGLNENDIREIRFLAADPDDGQRIQLSLSGVGFAALTPQNNGLYVLRLSPRANDAGRYTLRLTATDDVGGVTTLTIALRVSRPPVAVSSSFTTEEDTPRVLALSASDPDNDPLDYIIVTNPVRGSLSGTPPNLVYTPSLNLNGSDVFSFKVNDGLSDSATVTVVVFVTPVNDPPVLIAPGPMTIDTGQPLSFTVVAADVEGDALTFTATGLPGGATFRQINPTTAQFDWTPSAIQYGAQTVTFTVRDNGAPPLSAGRNTAITVTPKWKPTAPIEGGEINVLLSRGTDVFAGTQGAGIFRSSNQGQSWTAANNGLISQAFNVRALAANGATLFAALDYSGVFASTDNGQTWRPANVGLSLGVFFNAFAVSGTTLFVGTDNGNPQSPGGGVYRSTDNGQSWTSVSTGITNSRIRSLAVVGTNLFAGTVEGRVFLSTNQGQSWTLAGTGLTTNQEISSFAVVGANLFAGTRGSGVFVTTNQGQSWTPANTGLPGLDVTSLLASGGALYAGTNLGVFLSADDAQNWARVSTGFPDLYATALGIAGANLFAGTNGRGVFLSANGQRWVEANTGLTAASARALAVSGTTLFAGTNGDGVYLSLNQGQSWIASRSGFPSSAVLSFVVSGTSVFAATYGFGVRLTTDNGQTWTAMNNGLTDPYVYALAMSGTNLFAGTLSGGVFLSTNNGQSWTPVNEGLTTKFVISLAAIGSNLYAGTYGGGIFVSANNGQSWRQINTGLTNLNINTIGAIGQTLFVGTDGPLFRSTNQGQSWMEIIHPGLIGGTFHALATSGSNLFAGSVYGAFLSTDQGQRWTAANTGLANTNVFSFAVSGQTLFVGTYGGGVFVSQ